MVSIYFHVYKWKSVVFLVLFLLWLLNIQDAVTHDSTIPWCTAATFHLPWCSKVRLLTILPPDSVMNVSVDTHRKIPFEYTASKDLRSKTSPTLNLTKCDWNVLQNVYTHRLYKQRCMLASYPHIPGSTCHYCTFQCFSGHFRHDGIYSHSSPCYHVTISVILFGLCFQRVEFHRYFCTPL